MTHSIPEDLGDKDKCVWVDLRGIMDLVLTGMGRRKEEKEQRRDSSSH